MNVSVLFYKLAPPLYSTQTRTSWGRIICNYRDLKTPFAAVQHSTLLFSHTYVRLSSYILRIFISDLSYYLRTTNNLWGFFATRQTRSKIIDRYTSRRHWVILLRVYCFESSKQPKLIRYSNVHNLKLLNLQEINLPENVRRIHSSNIERLSTENTFELCIAPLSNIITVCKSNLLFATAKRFRQLVLLGSFIRERYS